jgi:polyphosphate kinase
VRSIVDRFLEHSRIWRFENACRPEVYVSSADWMPRNFFRRIEIAFPVEDGRLADRLSSEVLGLSFADNSKAHFLQPDGAYRRARPKKAENVRRSQFEFIALANGEEPRASPRGFRKTKYAEMRVASRPAALAESLEDRTQNNGER